MHEDEVPGEPSAADTRMVAFLVTLTATTGLVDAVSVLGLGRVFTANMTGNVAFLGFAVAGVPDFSAARSLVSLGAFLTGAVIGGRLAVRMSAARRRWLVVTFSIEAGLFFACAVYALVAPGSPWILIGVTAAAMGIRNATVRKLAVPDMTTTVLTLTLTGLGADSMLAGGSNLRWQRRAFSVLAMLVGAALGALLLAWAGLAVPLALVGVLVLAATFYGAR